MATFRAATEDQNNGTSIVLTIPATVQAGDFLLASVNMNSGNTPGTTPAGWTLVGTSSDSAQTLVLYSLWATSGTAGTTATFAINATGKFTANLAAWSDVDTGSPIMTSATLDSPGTSNSWTLSNLTAASAGLRVDFLTQRSSTPATAWTTPSGMTSRSEVYQTGSGSTYSMIADSGTAVGPGTVTGLTYSNNGSATSAAAFYSVILASAAPPLVADAGPDQTVTIGQGVALYGGATGGSGTKTYAWTFDSGPSTSTGQFSNTASATPTFTAALVGTYVLRMTVTDSSGSDADTVTVVANPVPSVIWTHTVLQA